MTMVRSRQKKGGCLATRRPRPGAENSGPECSTRRTKVTQRQSAAEVGKNETDTTNNASRACRPIGIGVHSGREVRVVLHPADADHGIVFLRTGLPGGSDRLIDARHLAVTATELCTVVGEPESGAVATVEHLMSALYGLGVDNVLVEIDGPEVPILDGSAAPFVDAIEQAGVVSVHVPRRYLKVLKPVRVTRGRAFAELQPNRRGFRLDVEIDFDNPIIGRQRRMFDLTAAPTGRKSHAPGPSASSATSRSSGKRASRWAPRSTTRSRSAKPP